MTSRKFKAETVAVAEIVVPTQRRSLNEERVRGLMDSILEIGLQTPITVRLENTVPTPDTGAGLQVVLIAGLHRLEAVKRLGHTHLPAVVRDCDELDAKLWEISENLHRAELTALERLEHMAEWVKLTTAKVGQLASPRGGKQPKDEGIRKAARELHVDPHHVRRAIEVAKLSDEAKQAARELGLDDNQSVLLKAKQVGEDNPEAEVRFLRNEAERRAVKRAEVANDVHISEVDEAAYEIACRTSDGLPVIRGLEILRLWLNALKTPGLTLTTLVAAVERRLGELETAAAQTCSEETLQAPDAVDQCASLELERDGAEITYEPLHAGRKSDT